MLGGDNGPAWALWCCPASHLHPSTIPLSGPSWDSRVHAVLVPRLLRSRLPPALPERFGTHMPLPGQGKVLSTSPGKNRAPTLPSPAPACQKKVFLSAPEAVFLLPSSLCRAGFARERTGLPSPTVSAPQPGNWERVFFITNKLGVIAVSTVATPRPGEAPSHTGACRSSPMAREPRHPQPRSRPCSRQQQ